MWYYYLIAPALFVLGVLAKSFHEKLTRETTEPELKKALRVAFAEFKVQLIDELNGTYVRSAGADVTGAEIKRRLEFLEQHPRRA